MKAQARPRQDPRAGRVGGRTWMVAAAWLLAGAVVATGLAAQVWRPLAPDLGPAPDPSAWFDAAFVARARAYSGPLYAAGVARIAVAVMVPFLLARTSVGAALLRGVVARCRARPGAVATGVAATTTLLVADLVAAPLVFWATFVHEGAFGLRTSGLGGWARDWLLARLPSWVAAAVLVPAGLGLLRRLPAAGAAVAGVGGAVVAVTVVGLAPLVLEPLEYRLRPLPDGPVRAEVQRVLDNAGVRARRLLVADASRRTTRQNAYVSGLGATRRVVLYDTLVQGRPAREVGLILAHELGHEQHADILRGALLAAAGSVVGCALVGLAVRRDVCGAAAALRGDPRAVAVVVGLVVALEAASLPVAAAVSRRAEAAADLAALDASRDPSGYRRMLVGLATANLGDPAPPRWAELWWFSHPPITARLELARRWPDVALRPP